MRERNLRSRWDMAPAEIMAAYVEDRDDELLDAVATSAALVARADGWVQRVELGQLLDFLDRHQLPSLASRDRIFDAFRRCLRELNEPQGPAAALERLRRYAGHPLKRVIIDIGEEVAAADCRLDGRERRVLHFIRTVLRHPHPPSAPPRHRAGGST